MTRSEIIEYLKDDVYSYCKDRLKRKKKVILPSALLIDAVTLLENTSDKNIETLISVNNPFMVVAGKKTLKNKIELNVEDKPVSFKTFYSIKECITAYLQSKPNLVNGLGENTSCELGTVETEIYNNFNLEKLDNEMMESYYGEVKTSIEISTSNPIVTEALNEVETPIAEEPIEEPELSVSVIEEKKEVVKPKSGIVLGTKILCTKAPIYSTPDGGVPKLLGEGFYYITNPNPINDMYAIVRSKDNVGAKGKLAGYMHRRHMAICD